MRFKQTYTAVDAESVQRYFNEISTYEVLTKQQEHELIRAYQVAGDQAAFDRVVKANLRFVVSVAKKYAHQGVPLGDLIQEANLGLLDAVRGFDLSRDLKLFSYAVWRMDRYVSKRLELNRRLVQLPSNRELLMTKVRLAYLALEYELERPPVAADIVPYLAEYADWHVSEADVNDALLHVVNAKAISLSDPHLGKRQRGPWPETHSPSKLSLEDVTPGDLDVDQADGEASLLAELARYLTHLTQVEYDVTVLRLGLNSEPVLRPSDLARALGLKVKDVPFIKNRALKRLRKLKGVKNLKEHL